jgi:hypothetical protein
MPFLISISFVHALFLLFAILSPIPSCAEKNMRDGPISFSCPPSVPGKWQRLPREKQKIPRKKQAEACF